MNKTIITDHIHSVCKIIELPNEACVLVDDMLEKIFSNWELESNCAIFVASVFEAYRLDGRNIVKFAEEKELDPQVLLLTVALMCTYNMRQMYLNRGWPMDICYDSMKNITVWTLNYYNNTGKWGLQEFSWCAQSFVGYVFRIGRLEFQPHNCNEPSLPVTICGIKIEKGSKVLNIHIPEGDGITKEKRMDSYRRAYKFFGQTGHAVFMCSSWLLYPEHCNFLNPNSNIIDFIKDFNIYRVNHGNGHLGRVFGSKWYELNGDPDLMPQNSAVQRAYVKHLKNGGTSGDALGFFVFDGKEIIS